MAPNNSFKPNLLRYGKSVAEKACHAFVSTPQVGLTQALDTTGEFMRHLLVLLLATVLVGCVSTEMKSYVGKDIREVILVNGQPIAAMDMGNGVRAFQFKWGGGTFTVPQTTHTTGQVTSYGNSAWLNATSITTGGGTFHSEGCVISYLTEWDEKTQGWIVHGYRYPKQLVC